MTTRPREATSEHRRAAPLTEAEVRERKQRILTHGTPSITRSIAQAVVIKDENLFLLTDPDGNVPVGDGHGLGLYYHDCRYLRGYELRLAGEKATVLASSAELGNAAAFQLANPDLRSDGCLITKESLGVRWTRALDGATHELHDVITFQNFGLVDVAIPVTLRFAAQFEDVFAVRGLFSEENGTLHPPAWHDDCLVFAYDGRDGRARRVVIAFSPAPDTREAAAACFHVSVPSRGTARIDIRLRVVEEPEPSGTAAAAPRARPDREPKAAHHSPRPRTSMRSDSLLLDAVVARALGDLRMLHSNIDGQEFFAAGVPWFATLFGRDSIITALQTLAWEPGIAEHTARLLARYQGHRTDLWRDEQPGKILHSIRVGEMARLGEIPHTPYYGSVDATPLFLILIGRHAEWTGTLDLFRDLRDHIELALRWMREGGDPDGDGYIEYASTSEHGLINQGWKDSGDAIVDADGRLADPPIALVEVQGYAYQARLLIAALYERDGDAETARYLRSEAAALRARFNRDFWIEPMDCYALALERDKAPLRVVSSNPGHALWAGIADEDKGRRTGARLMQEDVFNGWGIRTLSERERRFNPTGYHLGTVWPHDNSIIAMGFRRYGLDEAAARVFRGVVEAAMHLTGYRLPELLAGFSRAEYATPVHFPVACHPQAWAAGSVPYLVEMLLGLVPNAFERRLDIVRPMLPDFVDRIELHDVTVGDASVSLRFQRAEPGGAKAGEPGGRVNVTVLDVQGKLDVVVDSGEPKAAAAAD